MPDIRVPSHKIMKITFSISSSFESPSTIIVWPVITVCTVVVWKKIHKTDKKLDKTRKEALGE